MNEIPPLRNCAMDSTRWDSFRYRSGDIVVGAWGKSGTTWTLHIVAQLIFDGEENLPVDALAPWVELRLTPLEELLSHLDSQTHRRFVKTHLPADVLRLSPEAKYIYLARDGRDVAWSMYNHLMKMTPAFYDAFNETPGRVGPPIERPAAGPRQFFHDWLDGNVALWPYWPNVQSWWNVRDLPNVLLIHFNELKSDLSGQIRRIADFLELPVDESLLPRIVEHCRFDYMKANADAHSVVLKHLFEGGMQSFIYKGTNGRWHDVLNADDLEKYQAAAVANLTPDCARWLAGVDATETANARAG